VSGPNTHNPHFSDAVTVVRHRLPTLVADHPELGRVQSSPSDQTSVTFRAPAVLADQFAHGRFGGACAMDDDGLVSRARRFSSTRDIHRIGQEGLE
jgi:hypothetical protein